MKTKTRPKPDPDLVSMPVPDSDDDADTLRLWLYLVKTVLPLERDVSVQLQRECGQSLTRFDVLAQLDRHGSQGVGQLAQRLIASAGNITSLLNRMEREGLVSRGSDDADRRAQRIQATELGVQLYWDMIPVHTAIIRQRLARVSSGDKVALIKLLKKLVD